MEEVLRRGLAGAGVLCLQPDPGIQRVLALSALLLIGFSPLVLALLSAKFHPNFSFVCTSPFSFSVLTIDGV